MGDWLAPVLATFVTLPLLLFWLVYAAMRLFGGRKRAAFYAAVNAATAFFIAAVYFFACRVVRKVIFCPSSSLFARIARRHRTRLLAEKGGFSPGGGVSSILAGQFSHFCVPLRRPARLWHDGAHRCRPLSNHFFLLAPNVLYS